MFTKNPFELFSHTHHVRNDQVLPLALGLRLPHCPAGLGHCLVKAHLMYAFWTEKRAGGFSIGGDLNSELEGLPTKRLIGVSNQSSWAARSGVTSRSLVGGSESESNRDR